VGIESAYGQAVLLIALFGIVPLAIAWPDRHTRWACLLTMAALGGCGTALLIHPPVTPGDLAYYNQQPGAARMLVLGVVTGEPVFTDRSQRLRVSAEEIRLSGESIPHPIKGNLYAVVARYPEYQLRAQLSLSGTLTAPPKLSQFDYPTYLARQGIFSYMTFPRVTSLGSTDTGISGAALSHSRSAIADALRRGISEPQAALAVGVVTGDRSQIPDEVQDAFRQSGTLHIVAISGQNIALITGVVWLFYGANPRRRMTKIAFLVSAATIAIYTIFTGAGPAVVRAAIMGIILLFAPIVRRRYDPIAALAIAATAMVIFDPDVLADPGFQLSFAAMFGMATLAAPLYALTQRLKIPRVLGLPIAVSLAAQSATMPIVALLTGQISTVALPATLIAEVALLPLMITGIAAGIFGAIFTPLAIPLGLLVWPFAAWILWWVQFWASFSWASVDVTGANPAWVVVYYGIATACLWLVNRSKKTPLVPRDWANAGLGVAAVTLWLAFVELLVT
jgi:competence protein ComEC